MIGFILLFLLVALPFGIAGTDVKLASQISGLILIGVLFYLGKFVWAILTSWMFWVIIGLLVVGFLYWFFFKLDEQVY